MKTGPIIHRLRKASALCFLHSALLVAGPMTVHEAASIKAELERMHSSLDGCPDTSSKIRYLQNELAHSSDDYMRHEILRMAGKFPGDDFEKLLIGVVKGDSDVGMRLFAVETLAKSGTAQSIEPLLDCACNDPAGDHLNGCIMEHHTSARRDAFLALAELGLRLPSERERIAKAIQKIPATSDDSRTDALYILTGDNDLLGPFYERLVSPDAKTRVSGVVAFQFLKLKRAPKGVVQLIHDPDPDVRQWVAIVLGEIGDPESPPILMGAAGNKELDRGTRCNAIGSLGRMHAAAATDLLNQLLSDEDVKINAAVAISQITGKRHPFVPDGYDLR